MKLEVFLQMLDVSEGPLQFLHCRVAPPTIIDFTLPVVVSAFSLWSLAITIPPQPSPTPPPQLDDARAISTSAPWNRSRIPIPFCLVGFSPKAPCILFFPNSSPSATGKIIDDFFFQSSVLEPSVPFFLPSFSVFLVLSDSSSVTGPDL